MALSLVDNMNNSQIEKIKTIENIFIATPKLQEIINDIEDCRTLAKINDYETEPDNILITGHSGSGKSWLINEYCKLNPRIEEEERTRVQVLSSTIPKATTAKPVVQTLLIDIGDPLQGKGDTIAGLTNRLNTLIRQTATEILIIDEFQHAIQTDSKKVIHDIGDWIKTIINLTKRPIILMGMHWSHIILETNPQLARRFRTHHNMPTYNSNNFDEFRAFLNKVDYKLPFSNKIGLDDRELSFRLLVCCEGNIGILMKGIIKKAANLAVIKNLKKPPLEYFAYAVEKYLDFERNTNPMRLPIDEIEFKKNNKFDKFPASRVNLTNDKKPEAIFFSNVT